MGRTRRQRSRTRKEKTKAPVNLSSDDSFVRLTRWMSSRGWKQPSKLCLAKFENTGRGLMARHPIQSGDVLVSIPASLLITTATVCNSAVGHILKTSATKAEVFLCQEILALFLLWERHLGNSSIWKNYIDTLPLSFTTPHGLHAYHVKNFPWFLQENVCNSLQVTQNCFKHLSSILQKISCDHCQIAALDIFTWDSFLWGWCCVNTRAVFIEPENVPPHSLVLKDRNCLALAPYLDMFNHSDTAKVNVDLNPANNCYEIVTLQPVSKFKEVFINYGPHSNSKLFLEYGFILPTNVQDSVPVTFDHILEACKLSGCVIQYEYNKVKFLKKHNLISQLYVSDTGLSWNCSTLLKILLTTSCDAKFWEQLSFMGSDSDSMVCDTSFNNVVQSTVRILKNNLVHCKNLLLQDCNQGCCVSFEGSNNPILEVCGALLQNLISILEAADILTEKSSYSSCIL